MPMWSKLSLPDANSPMMEQMIYFHDHTMMILFMVTILILYMLISSINNKLINKSLLEGQELETIWTMIPAILLIFIAFPSLYILYMLEDTPPTALSIKVVAHQWYWSYQYSNFSKLALNSFIISNDKLDAFRLLEAEPRMVIPTSTTTRLLISSQDVIHSWTVPTLGVKADAMPGRINQIFLIPLRPGVYFGQCSEICGAKHSFMPITLEAIPQKAFYSWIRSN